VTLSKSIKILAIKKELNHRNLYSDELQF